MVEIFFVGFLIVVLVVDIFFGLFVFIRELGLLILFFLEFVCFVLSGVLGMKRFFCFINLIFDVV